MIKIGKKEYKQFSLRGSMERLESASAKGKGFTFADHIAHFESPEAKAQHDKRNAEFLAGIESAGEN